MDALFVACAARAFVIDDAIERHELVAARVAAVRDVLTWVRVVEAMYVERYVVQVEVWAFLQSRAVTGG